MTGFIVLIIISAVCFALAFLARPGASYNGQSTCTAKVISVDNVKNTVTIKYKFRKQEYIREVSREFFGIVAYKGRTKAIKIESDKPENIIRIIHEIRNFNSTFRILLMSGIFSVILAVIFLIMS